MRVLFNGASTIRPKTGVGHTTLNLHRALTELSPRDRFWLYPGDALRSLLPRFLQSQAKPNPSAATPDPDAPGFLRDLTLRMARFGYAAHFHATARLGGFDLYHEPNLVPFAVNLPTVVTVHDLSVLMHPEWHPADRVKRYEKAFMRGIAGAVHVLVVSETIRSEAIEYLGLGPHQVTAVHNGISANFLPPSAGKIAELRTRLELPNRYLLTIGTIEPRKNIEMVMRAFCDLPATLREACPLLLGGKWGWKSERERTFYDSEARHRGVRSLGYVADEDLPSLYGGAAALLYPSFYEGFGLPPVEAMACGCAAIVSTASAVREVVGSHAIQLAPDDVAGWREAMRRAILEPDSLDRYRRDGLVHAVQFTWQRAAISVLDVYRRVLGIASPSPAPTIRQAA